MEPKDTEVIDLATTAPASTPAPDVTQPAPQDPPPPVQDPTPDAALAADQPPARILLDDASFDEVSKRLAPHPPVGLPVLFCFEDHDGEKMRPAFVLEAEDESVDLYVMFHPSDRIAGANAEPGAVLKVRHYSHPDVATDVLHRHWEPNHF